MEKAEIKKVLNSMGLSITTKFVPWSLSRNAGEKYPSLNYKVTLMKDEKEILTTDYMMGSGHCPAYKTQKQNYDGRQMVLHECENGFEATMMYSMNFIQSNKKKPIFPDIVDFMYSISMDSDVLDYEFEDWADSFGYDVDSRKAEKIYQECVVIATKLLRALKSSGLEKLHEIYQDY